MDQTALLIRKYELLRMRWQLENKVTIDPFVLPAALCWLDGEIDAMKKAITG